MKYRLPNDRNAISDFSAMIQLSGPLQPALHDSVRKEVGRIRTDFDLPAPIQMQVINFNLPISPAPPKPFFSGAQRFSPNGQVEESLLCDDQSITFTTKRYDGWENVKARVVGAIDPVFRLYMSGLPLVTSFRLQYINEFFCDRDSIGSPFEILREKNKWIPDYLSDSVDAWHLHTGRFIPTEGDERLLINVNFDYSENISPENEVSRRLGVLIMSGIFYNTPGKKPLILDVENMDGLVADYFERAHVKEKEMLEEIFSDEYLQAMGAKP